MYVCTFVTVNGNCRIVALLWFVLICFDLICFALLCFTLFCFPLLTLSHSLSLPDSLCHSLSLSLTLSISLPDSLSHTHHLSLSLFNIYPFSSYLVSMQIIGLCFALVKVSMHQSTWYKLSAFHLNIYRSYLCLQDYTYSPFFFLFLSPFFYLSSCYHFRFCNFHFPPRVLY